MKKSFYILLLLIVFIACDDKWDSHYYGESEGTETILDLTLSEFLAQDGYGRYKKLFDYCNLDTVLQRDQDITLWVVPDSLMDRAILTEEADTLLTMQYHMNYLPFLRTSLKDGLRIRSLNGVYLQIERQGNDIRINNSNIIESYQLKNGVVHVIDRLMTARMNLFDYIKYLPDDYSIFRDSVMAMNVMVFDEKNSTKKSVDETGNWIYDSVFYVYNPLFEKAEFNSEFKQFTLLTPDNDVVAACFEKLKEQFRSMGQEVKKEDTVKAMTWIKEAAFYDGILSMNDFSDGDLKSSFERVWRNTVQKVDPNSMEEMSNGVVYEMTDIKIPTNYILDRIKSLIHYWEYIPLTTEERNQYPYYVIKPEDAKFQATDDKGATVPRPEIRPTYRTFDVEIDNAREEELSVEICPVDIEGNIMTVPTGEYILYMGFRSSVHPYVNISFQGIVDPENPDNNGPMVELGKNFAVVNSNPWNYDRNNETEDQRIPGGKSRWDGLGGYVGTVYVGEEGETGMRTFRIKVEFSQLYPGGLKRMQLYHWSLKPSDSNY